MKAGDHYTISHRVCDNRFAILGIPEFENLTSTIIPDPEVQGRRYVQNLRAAPLALLRQWQLALDHGGELQTSLGQRFRANIGDPYCYFDTVVPIPFDAEPLVPVWVQEVFAAKHWLDQRCVPAQFRPVYPLADTIYVLDAESDRSNHDPWVGWIVSLRASEPQLLPFKLKWGS